MRRRDAFHSPVTEFRDAGFRYADAVRSVAGAEARVGQLDASFRWHGGLAVSPSPQRKLGSSFESPGNVKVAAESGRFMVAHDR